METLRAAVVILAGLAVTVTAAMAVDAVGIDVAAIVTRVVLYGGAAWCALFAVVAVWEWARRRMGGGR